MAGCSDDEINLEDGDKQVTEEMDKVISDYIIQIYTNNSYSVTDKQIEVHKVFGTSELDGIISVYMWSYFNGFNKSTGVETISGHSLPAVIRLSKNEENYSVIEYIEPQDGSLYKSSLEKMFPKKYIKNARQYEGNVQDLQKEMDKKVRQWLEEQE